MDMMRVHFDELQERPSAAIDLTLSLLDFVPFCLSPIRYQIPLQYAKKDKLYHAKPIKSAKIKQYCIWQYNTFQQLVKGSLIALVASVADPRSLILLFIHPRSQIPDQLSKMRVWGLGNGIRKKPFLDLRSQMQGPKRHRIQDPGSTTLLVAITKCYQIPFRAK